MRAVMLAAGVGARLADGKAGDHPPKVLLEVGGRSLLRRHIDILRRLGITELVLATGYRQADIEAEIAAQAAADLVRTVTNPDFREGSVVSLAVAGEALTQGGDVLLMDADVLYDDRMIARLLSSRHANCFLMDRDIEPGEEPMKLCVRGGEIVDFRKRVDTPHDFHGESVGFFRLSAEIARRTVDVARAYAAGGRRGELYEEAIRDVLLDAPAGTFGYEDISGLPWIEIDFPEDLVRARAEILPRLTEPA